MEKGLGISEEYSKILDNHSQEFFDGFCDLLDSLGAEKIREGCYGFFPVNFLSDTPNPMPQRVYTFSISYILKKTSTSGSSRNSTIKDGFVGSIKIDVSFRYEHPWKETKKNFFGFEYQIERKSKYIHNCSFIPFPLCSVPGYLRYNTEIDSYKSFIKKCNEKKPIYQIDYSILNTIIQYFKSWKGKLGFFYTNYKRDIDNNLNMLDSNSDGIIDRIETDNFYKIFQKNQSKIIEVDKLYVHRFVQLSNFIKLKKNRIQKLFKSIKKSRDYINKEYSLDVLNSEITSYESIVFHSNNMIISLVSGDLITFYELYEAFDKLGMFKSSWENEVSICLLSINNNLESINYSIYNFENNVVNALNKLTYVSQSSFDELNRSVKRELSEI
jgi:hypothetical protein